MAAIDAKSRCSGSRWRACSPGAPASPAGCYCDAASRQHKWGLVLETIHYALHHRKNGQER
jgi:hypothetical protein